MRVFGRAVVDRITNGPLGKACRSGQPIPRQQAEGSAFKHKLFHAAQAHGEEAEAAVAAACEYQ